MLSAHAVLSSCTQRSRLAVVLLALALQSSACAGSTTPAVSPVTRAEAEPAVVVQARAFERELVDKGLVLTDDPELLGYLDGVARRLVPMGHPPVRVGVVRDPAANAFALPQGSIYVTAGLLARLDNEAQLAHVLAHEIAHVARRHGIEASRDRKSKTVTAKLADLALGGVLTPVVALGYAASVNGYGREQEAVADADALRAIAVAGYRAEEGARVFATFDDEPEPGSLETFFFRGHPAHAERSRAAAALLAAGTVASGPGARVGESELRAATPRIAVRAIELALERQLYLQARKAAEREAARRGAEPRLVYLVAEARRLAAADPDAVAREEALRLGREPDEALRQAHRSRAAAERRAAGEGFRRALAADPTLDEAHRGLGLIALAEGDRAGAAAELRRYLASSDPLPDRRSMERTLEEVIR